MGLGVVGERALQPSVEQRLLLHAEDHGRVRALAQVGVGADDRELRHDRGAERARELAAFEPELRERAGGQRAIVAAAFERGHRRRVAQASS